MENEEASASVVVKMTDSFTEQADQVIPERSLNHRNRGAQGGLSSGDNCFLFSSYYFYNYKGHLHSWREIWKNFIVEGIMGKKKKKSTCLVQKQFFP